MRKKQLLLLSVLLCMFAFSACTKDASDKKGDEASDSTGSIAVIEDTAKDIADVKATVAPSDAPTAAPTATQATAPTEKHIVSINFTSKLLSDTLVENSPTKELLIYLPPNYYKSEKRYPVVYFFHGFSESPSFVRTAEKSFNQYMLEAGGKEFIVVGIDGRIKGSDGSFYSNSPVTGPWEDYVIDEIIPYIDENYRTIAKAESRGTAGFSMGGFACINLAFLHPDVFSSVLSLCPGLLKEGSLEVAMKSWTGDSQFLRCYGQTFSPNQDKDDFCDIPKMDGSEADAVIRDNWESGFGKLEEKIEAYLAKNQPLNKIEIIYGLADGYKWIPEGCLNFSELLTAKGIEHTMIETSGGHSIPSDYKEKYFIPYFSEALNFEE